jgi:myosin heavy subunit
MQGYAGQRVDATPPHVFAVAEQAYRRLQHMQQSQSVLISGESGAGKTEATKQVRCGRCKSAVGSA